MNTTKGNLGQVMLCDNHIDIHVDNFPNFPGSNIVKVIKLFFQSFGCIYPDPETSSNYYIKFLVNTCIS